MLLTEIKSGGGMSGSGGHTISSDITLLHKESARVRVPSGLYRVVALLIALGYGAALAVLPVDVFKDRHNYLIYASDSGSILAFYVESGLLKALANEPFWLLINVGLSSLLSPEEVVRFLVFLSATMVAYVVLRSYPRQFFWLLFILLLPQVIKNHIIHLRQGVAIALFLVGWNIKSVPGRWVLMGSAPFVHASFAFVVGLLALTKITKRLRLGVDFRLIIFVAMGMVIGIAIGWLAQLVGARQGDEYNFTAVQVSGLGFLFWSMVFALFVLQGKAFMRERDFALSALVFYLSTYFLIEVAARIFESLIIFVLFAGLHLTGWRRVAFMSSSLFYAGVMYGMRIDEPWLGFGFS